MHRYQVPFLYGSSPLARGTQKDADSESEEKRFIPAGAGNTVLVLQPGSARPVHPRWRGEHITSGLVVSSTAGSSPLARGTRRHTRRPAGHGRFIPAGAGNTMLRAPGSSRSSVHPRWRGEHTVGPSRRSPVSGSSPLARGTLSGQYVVGASARFIPAGAGNTLIRAFTSSTTAVHPRWRGEHHGVKRLVVAGLGSSPLARGTRSP